MTRAPVFEISDVGLQRESTRVLEDVTAVVPAGTCSAFVGPSGAGKSMLLRLLTRLEDPDTGWITFYGRPLVAQDVLELRQRVQLVAQQPVLVTGPIRDEIRVGRPELDQEAAAALLSRVGLPSSFLNRASAGLSGGEAQRVCLARALALEPEVLLLDEPTASLDAASATAIEDAVLDLVRRGGAVVLVSHNTAQVRRVTDRVIVMDRGRVVASGAPDVVEYPKAVS